jgi:hypothetical protein
MSIYMLMTDGAEIDQRVETIALAKREAKDLRGLGCEVRVYEFADHAAADRFEDRNGKGDGLTYPRTNEAKKLHI